MRVLVHSFEVCVHPIYITHHGSEKAMIVISYWYDGRI